jgi:hypothetical protein
VLLLAAAALKVERSQFRVDVNHKIPLRDLLLGLQPAVLLHRSSLRIAFVNEIRVQLLDSKAWGCCNAACAKPLINDVRLARAVDVNPTLLMTIIALAQNSNLVEQGAVPRRSHLGTAPSTAHLNRKGAR